MPKPVRIAHDAGEVPVERLAGPRADGQVLIFYLLQRDRPGELDSACLGDGVDGAAREQKSAYQPDCRNAPLIAERRLTSQTKPLR